MNPHSIVPVLLQTKEKNSCECLTKGYFMHSCSLGTIQAYSENWLWCMVKFTCCYTSKQHMVDLCASISYVWLRIQSQYTRNKASVFQSCPFPALLVWEKTGDRSSFPLCKYYRQERLYQMLCLMIILALTQMIMAQFIYNPSIVMVEKRECSQGPTTLTTQYVPFAYSFASSPSGSDCSPQISTTSL